MGTRRVSSPYGEFTLFFTMESPFSNFYPCILEQTAMDGSRKQFSCVEQFYMYKKAISASDQRAAERIMSEHDPKEMKRIGKEIVGFDRDRRICARIVSSGLPIDSPDAVNPSRWRGKNRLGFLLDAVREKLWKVNEYRAEREEVESQMSLYPGYADLCFSSISPRSQINYEGANCADGEPYGCREKSRHRSGDGFGAKRNAQAKKDFTKGVCMEKRRRSSEKNTKMRKLEKLKVL
ncbi:hypothetical protein Angca_001206, partial [Angiostrongylus cantonensis]